MTVQKAKKGHLWNRILIFLAIIGPGIITGSVDNDAGGITTYAVAGAVYGYRILWTLVPAFILLIIFQEMNARMGIITGKGLADLIRENAGVRITFFLFLGLLIADIGNTTTEFAGVAGSMHIFGVSKYISVPLVAFAVWFMVVKGTYRSVEKIFMVFSVFLLSFIISAVLGKPDWGEIGTSILNPGLEWNFSYIFIVVGMIGTTIAPWMQFYMQSSVIEKGLKIEDYKYTRWDVIIGCIITVAVAFFIIVACASTLHKNGVVINEAKDAAQALRPLAGPLAAQVFALALFVASMFSATILPVATSFYICEAFGFEAGIDKKIKEAPQFYTLYTSIIVVAAGIILIPNAPLIAISLWSQIINGLLLPVVLVFMILLVNNREVMGKYVNKPLSNIVGWVSVGLLSLLSLGLILLFIFGKQKTF